MPTPDLHPELPTVVTIDSAVLVSVLDDMATAADALESDSPDTAERDRCAKALRGGISELWLEARGDQLRPSAQR